MNNNNSSSNTRFNWINILEMHFNARAKAFVIFDKENIARYISDYARDILEIDDNSIGFITFNELFLAKSNTPNFLFDENGEYHTTYDITYTTPSGRPIEIRLHQDINKSILGYVVWIELRSREMTSVYKKVSAIDHYKQFKQLFSELDLGFMIINREGIIVDYNNIIKHVLRLPGDWEGRNIHTFPPLHQSNFKEFFQACLSNNNRRLSKKVKIQYSSKAGSVNLQLSGIPLSDFMGEKVGILLASKRE